MKTTPPEPLTARLLSLGVHELRTPVTVATGYIRMLLKEQAGPLSERQRDLLNKADKSCAILAALVADMSELARLEAGEFAFARQPVSLAALLSDVAADLREGSDRGVTLALDEVPEMLATTGDAMRLRTALAAVVHATLRERGEAGTVRLQVRRTAGPGVILAVGDEAAVAQAIDAPQDTPFDEWRGGVGFSLPTARRVIEAHDGRIWSLPGPRPRLATGIWLPMDRSDT